MRRWRGCRVLVGLFFALGLLPAEEGGAVAGRAVNTLTHTGIAGVEVRLWSKDVDGYTSATDADGAFRIDGIQPGRYYFHFAKSGYVSINVAEPARALRVGLSKEAIRLDVELTPSGTLAGRVWNSEGQPIARAEVLAMSRLQVLSAGSPQVTTDEEGRFAFDSLGPNFYTLMAKPPSVFSANPSIAGERMAAQPTYFPSTLDRAQAQVLNLQSAANLTGLDIRLRSAPVYRVRGVVLDEAGRPAENVEVALTPRAAETGSLAKYVVAGVTQYVIAALGALPEAHAVTGKDGAFEFPAVRSGDWLLAARLEGELPSGPARRLPAPRSAEESLQVERQDIDHAEIRLAAPFELPVEADWGDAPPDTRRRVAAVALSAVDGQPPLVFLGPPGIRIMPGRYRIADGPSINGYSLVSVLLAGQEVLGQVVDLRAGSGPLRAIYQRSKTSLRGTVEKGPGATVLVWPQIATGPIVMDTMTCGPNGNFEGFVRPGDYYVVAVHEVDRRTVADTAFLQKMIASAARVSVAEGATAVVQLPLTRWPQ